MDWYFIDSFISFMQLVNVFTSYSWRHDWSYRLQLQTGFSMPAAVTELGLRDCSRLHPKKQNLWADSDGSACNWWPLYAVRYWLRDTKSVAAGRVRQVAAIYSVYNTWILCGGIFSGRDKQVAVIDRWPLRQVWLYIYIFFFFFPTKKHHITGQYDFRKRTVPLMMKFQYTNGNIINMS